MSERPDGFPTLTLRGGGWIIVAFALVLGGFLAWAVSGVFVGERPVGGGTDPASYGFRLEPLTADRATLVGTGNPRDFLVALDGPSTIRGSEVLRWNQEHRGKLVVGDDRVAQRTDPTHGTDGHVPERRGDSETSRTARSRRCSALRLQAPVPSVTIPRRPGAVGGRRRDGARRGRG